MARYRDIEIVCKDCYGTGKKSFAIGVPPVEEDCQDCEGKGFKLWGRIKFKNSDFTED